MSRTRNLVLTFRVSPATEECDQDADLVSVHPKGGRLDGRPCSACEEGEGGYLCDACAVEEHSIGGTGAIWWLETFNRPEFFDKEGELRIYGQAHWYQDYYGEWDEDFEIHRWEYVT